MMVERYPKFKEEVGGSNLGCEISSLPNGILSGGQLFHMLWRWLVMSASCLKRKRKKRANCKTERKINTIKKTSHRLFWLSAFTSNPSKRCTWLSG
jgi:hypothetical protein